MNGWSGIAMAVALGLGLGGVAYGQGQSLASTMKVYVFPKTGQPAEQQSQDEAACYDWAVTNAGVDPFELKKELQANQQQAQAEQQAAAQASQREQATRQEMDNFRKAFSVCLEAKDYMVKY